MKKYEHKLPTTITYYSVTCLSHSNEYIYNIKTESPVIAIREAIDRIMYSRINTFEEQHPNRKLVEIHKLERKEIYYYETERKK